MKRAIILGSGMVGTTMAMDLANESDFEVTVAGVDRPALDRIASMYGVATVAADLSDPAVVRKTVAKFDVVLGALPSALGLQTLQAVIEAGRNYCDISFMAEESTELSALAKKHGVIAVTDCGVAPGLSNMMAGYGYSQLDACERIEILVGGLPVERRWPFQYKAGFAPHDVIEEYTRPSRLVENGKVVVREALSEPELLDFAGIGTLESFNTDGLRSLATTLDVPFMREKTLRYPGHIELMRVFRETGLFSKALINVKGQQVRPLDLMAALLFPKWTFANQEADLTVMRVEVSGKKGGRPTTYRWELLDYYDPETNTRSMSRTTAFPCTFVARHLASGTFPLGPGVYPPEFAGRQVGFLDQVLVALKQRGVRITAAIA